MIIKFKVAEKSKNYVRKRGTDQKTGDRPRLRPRLMASVYMIEKKVKTGVCPPFPPTFSFIKKKKAARKRPQ